MENLEKRRIVCPHCGAATSHTLRLADYIYLHKCHQPNCGREFAVSVTWKSTVVLLTGPAVDNSRQRTIGTVREYLTDCRAHGCQVQSWLPLEGHNHDQAAMFWCEDHELTVDKVLENSQRVMSDAYRAAHAKRMAREGEKRIVELDPQAGDTDEQCMMRCTAKTIGGNGARCSNMQWLSVAEVECSRPVNRFLCWFHERQRLAQSA